MIMNGERIRILEAVMIYFSVLLLIYLEREGKNMINFSADGQQFDQPLHPVPS
jgi:hypothetical protein